MRPVIIKSLLLRNLMRGVGDFSIITNALYSNLEDYLSPCGQCRQVMAEVKRKKFFNCVPLYVILIKNSKKFRVLTKLYKSNNE